MLIASRATAYCARAAIVILTLDIGHAPGICSGGVDKNLVWPIHDWYIPFVKKTRNIEQKVTFNAKPKKVFKALLNSAKHSAFTGEPARIDRKPGGAFVCYGEYIKGINLELEPNKRIVQAWRSRNWPKGTYSIVTFSFSRKAGGKTELRFCQIGVPADDYAEKSKGWRTHYWEPLRRFLQSE